MKKADATKTEEKPAKKETKPAAKKEVKPKAATKVRDNFPELCLDLNEFSSSLVARVGQVYRRQTPCRKEGCS